ncbi:hypothetical protein Nepgr_008586 [Nepenthes gracilis]|uniref:BHLH domain-containing protein n=1 Tax=Nepenthes gracilis TaxID=150966 RepID=A0AAD3S9B3_NEPGR|nr:hypothetical protein Nepgr_008586 [Nepenthes gracilis]
MPSTPPLRLFNQDGNGFPFLHQVSNYEEQLEQGGLPSLSATTNCQDLTMLLDEDNGNTNFDGLLLLDKNQQGHMKSNHETNGQEGSGSSSMKKLDHNAKERVRRLNLTVSHLALCSLFPDYHKPKKKWSAAHTIDRALEYIPELEGLVKKLTAQKNDMLSLVGKKRVLEDEEAYQTLTVSVNEIRKGEVIVQICMQRVEKDIFSHLVEKVEGEGMQLIGASSLYACEDRYCYHLHLQIDERLPAADYIARLKDKVVSWLI